MSSKIFDPDYTMWIRKEKIFYVPTQNQDKIVGFKYTNDTLEIVSEIRSTGRFF